MIMRREKHIGGGRVRANGPDPDAARVAIRIATRGATVYTNIPKRRREAISTDLCTLLRRRPGGEAHAAGAVTQPSTRTHEASVFGGKAVLTLF